MLSGAISSSTKSKQKQASINGKKDETNLFSYLTGDR